MTGVKREDGSLQVLRATIWSGWDRQSNRLAYAEAERSALALEPSYNPFYLYSAPGLGKTPLLQAIVHFVTSISRRGVYFTAEGQSAQLALRRL